jgi:hypothetical protein
MTNQSTPPKSPSFRAPMRSLSIGTIAAAVLAGLVAWLCASALRPDAAWAAWVGVPIVLIAAALSLAFVALQGSQTVIVWPSKWLAASGIRSAATLLFGVLGYILLKPDAVTYALALLGGYIAVLIVETTVFTAALNRTWKAETESAQTTDTEEPS